MTRGRGALLGAAAAASVLVLSACTRRRRARRPAATRSACHHRAPPSPTPSTRRHRRALARLHGRARHDVRAAVEALVPDPAAARRRLALRRRPRQRRGGVLRQRHARRWHAARRRSCRPPYPSAATGPSALPPPAHALEVDYTVRRREGRSPCAGSSPTPARPGRSSPAGPRNLRGCEGRTGSPAIGPLVIGGHRPGAGRAASNDRTPRSDPWRELAVLDRDTVVLLAVQGADPLTTAQTRRLVDRPSAADQGPLRDRPRLAACCAVVLAVRRVGTWPASALAVDGGTADPDGDAAAATRHGLDRGRVRRHHRARSPTVTPTVTTPTPHRRTPDARTPTADAHPDPDPDADADAAPAPRPRGRSRISLPGAGGRAAVLRRPRLGQRVVPGPVDVGGAAAVRAAAGWPGRRTASTPPAPGRCRSAPTRRRRYVFRAVATWGDGEARRQRPAHPHGRRPRRTCRCPGRSPRATCGGPTGPAARSAPSGLRRITHEPVHLRPRGGARLPRRPRLRRPGPAATSSRRRSRRASRCAR